MNEDKSKSIIEKMKDWVHATMQKFGLGEVENTFTLVFGIVLTTMVIFSMGLVKTLVVVLLSLTITLFATGKLNFAMRHLWNKIINKGDK